MALKYKIGDRVKIKSLDWYNENKNSDYGFVYLGNGICFYSHMSTYCGKTMTISKIFDCCYVMTECVYDIWTDEMIECKVEEENKPKFNVGDIVYSKTWQRNAVIMEILPDGFYKIGEYGIGWFKSHEDELCKDIVKSTHGFNLPDGYIFKDQDDNIINATKIVLEKKNEYPKTIEECCQILGLEFNPFYTGTKRQINYKDDLLYNLKVLLIYRDAYWRLYGEKIGLNKSWQPDWSDDLSKYYISFYNNKVDKGIINYSNKILAFPTAEMRDAFYENFKFYINNCKELL